MFDLAQAFGWIATFLFSIMIVPQMIKSIREKNVDGVSLCPAYQPTALDI
jgi:uncharacterized protein with PQ loop repeat